MTRIMVVEFWMLHEAVNFSHVVHVTCEYCVYGILCKYSVYMKHSVCVLH
jgi:hypothetical protein